MPDADQVMDIADEDDTSDDEHEWEVYNQEVLKDPDRHVLFWLCDDYEKQHAVNFGFSLCWLDFIYEEDAPPEVAYDCRNSTRTMTTVL